MRGEVHVVHVITRLLKAGSEENTIATCLDHVARGHRVTLIHGAEYDESLYPRLAGKVELVRISSLVHAISPREDLIAIARLRSVLLELQPQIVHTHQSKAGIIGRVAAVLAKVPAVVHTVHIAPFDNVGSWRRRFYISAERLCGRFTNVIITVSGGMRDLFISAGIASPAKYEVIHSGMDLDQFKSARRARDWRKRIGGWSAYERPRIILMLAAFEPRKRHRELLHAVAHRLRDRTDLCLVLAGTGPMLDACRADALKLQVQEQVRFVGYDPSPEKLIALADVCVLTSIREGLPRAVVQYIAGGKPVVLSPLPGIDDLIVPGINGIVAQSDDIEDFVTELFALVDDEDRLFELSSGARSTDLSRWQEDVMGQLIEAAYVRALDPHQAAA